MIDNLIDSQWRRSRIRHRVIHPIHKYIYPTYRNETNVLDEDWDSLIVLDGCRADLFEQHADLTAFDNYQTVESTGSDSQEWLNRTFDSGHYGDTVYVTANPHTTKLVGNSFHEMINVWKDGFDDQLQTTPPETVRDAALQAFDEYPNKRLIIHFIQPHHPFIDADIPMYSARTSSKTVGGDDSPRHVWEALRRGLIPEEKVWEAYGDNLSTVLDYTHELLDELDGKTVVTSDHGNALGERAWPVPFRLYGHPGGMRTPALTRVPWATVEKDHRRTVQTDGVNPTAEYDETLVEGRLADLGYLPSSEETET